MQQNESRNISSVAFCTLGCKLNFAETSTLKRHFRGRDFEIRPFDSQADVYVINTCSVTLDANRDCRKIVRRARRLNPEAFIVVTGCYAQLEPEEIAEIKGVDLVVGTRDKFDILELAGNFEKSQQTIIHRTDVNEAAEFHHAFSSSDRTRAFLKVQDGCDYKCSFCTIPMARGRSRSPDIGKIVADAQKVTDDGYQEIVLTGVNVGDFGNQSGETLLELLIALDRIKGLDRIRISSIEPNLLTNEIIEFVAKSRAIQPHFHIPLQSGSDRMLKLMKRRYNTDVYHYKVKKIKSCMPHACIGVDVITGHPGETDTLFQETLKFIRSIDISYLHVFTYSERPNTVAINLPEAVPGPVRKKRTNQLRRLSEQKRFDFDSSFLNSNRSVLFEIEPQNGVLKGWTDNYIRVCVPYNQTLMNRIVSCRLIERHPGDVVSAAVVDDAVNKSGYACSSA